MADAVDGTQNALLGLGWSLDLLHGLAEAQVFQHLAGRLHGGDISFSQLNALYRLYRDGPQTIAEVAKSADLSPTAASRMVERLVQAGLVTRREGLSDRRQKRVELTSSGRDWLMSMQRFTAETYAGLLAKVPAQIRDRLAEVLIEMRPFLPQHPFELGEGTKGGEDFLSSPR